MVVLSTSAIISCSYMLSPVVPIFYNTSLLLGNKNYLKKKDEFIVIIPEQLASVNTIAVMPVQVASLGFTKHLRIYPKDFSISSTAIMAEGKDMGLICGELLEMSLRKHCDINIVERGKLHLLLNEHKIMQSGIAGDHIQEIVGATAGADAIFVSTVFANMIIPDKTPILINYYGMFIGKLIDTRNGKIIISMKIKLANVLFSPTTHVQHMECILELVAKQFNEALTNSRKKYPKAVPPSRADYLKIN